MKKLMVAAFAAMSIGTATAWSGSDGSGRGSVPGANGTPGRECRAYRTGDPTVYRTDFEWGLSVPELNELGRRLYRDSKRLAHRFYRTPHGEVRAPVRGLRAVAEIAVPRSFLSVTIRQIERALRMNVIDHLSLADTGHTHFYVPNEHSAGYQALLLRDQSAFYGMALADPGLHVLFHAAERLKFRERRSLVTEANALMRFATRNLWGRPDGEIQLVHDIDLFNMTNVVDRVEGYTNIGMGYFVHAQINGCFQARLDRRVVNFDLSFVAPTGRPGATYDE